jgi:hypothetical protein
MPDRLTNWGIINCQSRVKQYDINKQSKLLRKLRLGVVPCALYVYLQAGGRKLFECKP